MKLSFYNTLTRHKEPFTPLNPGRVSVYSCGPTVYSRQHIGNMRGAIFVDVLKRTLRFNGYEVNDVVNITDVGHLVSDEDQGEDKMQKAAREQHKDPYDIACHWEEVYRADLEALNIIPPKHLPRATDHITEQLEFIRALEKNGYTYITSDGVYFDTRKLPDYGKLSRQRLEDKEAGARVAVDSEKRNPTDFALWKFLTKENKEHVMQWKSPWGVGFPGWHLECSAMSHKYLGSAFDIHTGGIEHIPVHHENEIAQNEGSGLIANIPFWIHNEHLLMDGGKMAKSLGNVLNLDDLKERGISPPSFRYLMLTAHYRSPISFTWESAHGAQQALMKLTQAVLEKKQEDEQRGGTVPPYGAVSGTHRERFLDCINDDLNTPQALALTWEMFRDEKLSLATKRATLLDFDKVFGLGFAERAEELKVLALRRELAPDELPPDIADLIRKREDARTNKDWDTADAVREELKEKGYALKDSEKGVSVHTRNRR